MATKAALLATVLAALAVPCAARQAQLLEVPEDQVKVATPQCSGGVVYDDGTFTTVYTIGDGDPPGDAVMAMRFDLPAGTTALDQACFCFSRSAGGPASMGFAVVAFDDNGPGGQPGTFLGTLDATASAIPVFPGTQFYPVDLAGSGIDLPDTGVYVGARWSGGQIFLCGDTSPATPQRQSFGLNGSAWTSLATFFPSNPPRAMGIRVDPATTSAACAPGPTTLCLNGGRFKVEALFRPPGGTNMAAHGVQLTEDTGYLWFFSASNVEAVIKVLNACSFGDRFWVFAGGLTNVRTQITVTDTLRGVSRQYTNPANTAFQPIQDTDAFATCP